MNNRIKYILIFLLTLCFVNCSKDNIEGYYYHVSNQQIFNFKKSELLIYSLKDSVQKSFSVVVKKDEFINLRDEQDSYSLNYLVDTDSLWLIDDQRDFLNNENIKLIKFELGDKINRKLIFQNYWYYQNDNNAKTDFWFQFILEKADVYGNTYSKETDSVDISIGASFDIKESLYFNTFNIYKFKSYVWSPYGYLLMDVSKDTLKFRELNTFNEMKFSNYSSRLDSGLYGTWINLPSDKNNLMLFNGKGRFYFGDTITFTKNKFIRKLKESPNFYYQDTIMISKENNNRKGTILNKPMSFLMGLDTKYLIFEKPLDLILQIKRLNKDTLIIKNNTAGQELDMKYIRLKSQ